MAFSLFLAMLIGWCSASQLLAQTPLGIQCPTAEVQQIAVPVKFCCGKAVAYEVRTPQPGEKGFLQCRCAEKRSAQQQADLDRNGPHIEMLPVSTFVLTLPTRIPEALAVRTIHTRLTAVSFAPPVPPPSC